MALTHPEETSPRAEEQLEAIRSMLSAGHHTITLELHRFALWGLGSAFALQVAAVGVTCYELARSSADPSLLGLS